MTMLTNSKKQIPLEKIRFSRNLPMGVKDFGAMIGPIPI